MTIKKMDITRAQVAACGEHPVTLKVGDVLEVTAPVGHAFSYAVEISLDGVEKQPNPLKLQGSLKADGFKTKLYAATKAGKGKVTISKKGPVLPGRTSYRASILICVEP